MPLPVLTGCPRDKEAPLTLGGATIKVIVTGPKHEFSFNVSKLGEIAENP